MRSSERRVGQFEVLIPTVATHPKLALRNHVCTSLDLGIEIYRSNSISELRTAFRRERFGSRVFVLGVESSGRNTSITR